MSRIKQPSIDVVTHPEVTIPEELLKVRSGVPNLENNARVDKTGVDHLGGAIYKVVINGGEPLYLSDARLDFGNPVVTTVLSVHSHKHSGLSNNDQVTTTGGEPSIHGRVAGGLSAEWMDWYRHQNGCTLIEARDAGLLRLAEMKRSRGNDRESN